jgi:hypothetical protein
VRARPSPIFGRPVHQGSPPFDYSPILLLKPFGFRIAPNTLSSGKARDGGFRSVLAVSGFRLRARLDFSIPAFSSRPARHYPRLRIQRPSFERRGDFNPHDSHAAQRTLRQSLTSTTSVHHRLRLLASPMRTSVLCRHRSDVGSPGSRPKSFCTCQFLRPRRAVQTLALSRPSMLPSAFATASAPRI